MERHLEASNRRSPYSHELENKGLSKSGNGSHEDPSAAKDTGLKKSRKCFREPKGLNLFFSDTLISCWCYLVTKIYSESLVLLGMKSWS